MLTACKWRFRVVKMGLESSLDLTRQPLVALVLNLGESIQDVVPVAFLQIALQENRIIIQVRAFELLNGLHFKVLLLLNNNFLLDVSVCLCF